MIPRCLQEVVGAMATLNEAEQLISTMTAGEKAQVLKWIARDFDGSPPGVESDLTIAGGEHLVFCEPVSRSGYSFRAEN